LVSTVEEKMVPSSSESYGSMPLLVRRGEWERSSGRCGALIREPVVVDMMGMIRVFISEVDLAL